MHDNVRSLDYTTTKYHIITTVSVAEIESNKASNVPVVLNQIISHNISFFSHTYTNTHTLQPSVILGETPSQKNT